MVRPRVAITGIGVVSPFGVGRERFWTTSARAAARTRAITDFDASAFACTVAAPVPASRSIDDAAPVGRPGRRRRRTAAPDPRRYSRASLIAVIAAREAWTDAGLRSNEPGAGVIVGSGAGGIDVARAAVLRVLQRRLEAGHALRHPGVDRRHDVERDFDRARTARHQPRRCRPAAPARPTRSAMPPRSSAAATRTCCSSGGADACVTPGMIFGFSKMRVVVDALQRRARPRRRARSTAGATASCSARARGCWSSSARIARARAARRIYATIDGYGSTCDAYHRVQMDPDGEQIVRAMTLAIERSGRALERDRLRQLSRHVDAAERRRRVALRAAGVRRARRSPCRDRRPSR